jgi:hypothetical protein
VLPVKKFSIYILLQLEVFFQQDKDSSMSDRSSGHLGELCDDQKQQQERRGLLQKIAQYENGERGFLNPVFPGALRDWLEHCSKLGMPSFL